MKNKVYTFYTAFKYVSMLFVMRNEKKVQLCIKT